MPKHENYVTRAFERLAIGPMGIHCLPGDRPVAQRIASTILSMPKVTADPVIDCFAESIIGDNTFMLPKTLPEIRWNLPSGWIEMRRVKGENNPVLPRAFGVYVRCNAIEEMKSENLKELFTEKGAVTVYSCVMFAQHRIDRKQFVYSMDPFATAIITDADGNVFPDHYTIMLSPESDQTMSPEIAQKLEEMAHHSARTSALAILALSMSITHGFPTKTVAPPGKLQKLRAQQGRALLMNHTQMQSTELLQQGPEKAVENYLASTAKDIQINRAMLSKPDVIVDREKKNIEGQRVNVSAIGQVAP